MKPIVNQSCFYSTDHDACKRVMDRVFKVLKRDQFDEDKAQFYSCLRPLCGDDVPIIGNTCYNYQILLQNNPRSWAVIYQNQLPQIYNLAGFLMVKLSYLIIETRMKSFEWPFSQQSPTSLIEHFCDSVFSMMNKIYSH